MLSIINASGTAKLQYWGFSYGTVLGATFAAMFPDKVGRVIIDGVVDSENYYSGLWSNNLRDTDADLLDFYSACVDAGPSKCPIHENSTSLVKERIDNLLTKLKIAPVPLYETLSVHGSGRFQNAYYDVVDYTMVKQVIFAILYQTHSLGAYLANALAELERGNGEMIWAMSMKHAAEMLMTCDCPVDGESPVPPRGLFEATLSIGCGDVVEPLNESLEELREAYEEMAKTSMFADGWFIRAACSGWKVRAKERFTASFNQTTSHPLLIIGNTADPVTPLWNAHKMSEGFTDSVVLTQNSPGHCSIAATSLCTVKAIRAYFQNGTLPEKGTVCEVESSIFGDALDMSSLNAEDRELVEASQILQQANFVPVLPLGPSFARGDMMM